MNELKTLYLTMLDHLRSIEDQIIASLPSLIEKSSSDALKMALDEHLEETRMHRSRIDEIVVTHEYSTTGEDDPAFAALLSQAEEELGTITDPMVRDAHIIASARVVEHLEMAKYMTLIEWARELDDTTGKDLLKETLAEEEAADKKLAKLAEGGLFTGGINAKASERVL